MPNTRDQLDSAPVRLIALGLLVAGLQFAWSASALAQQSYGQYYQQQFKQTGGGGLGSENSNRYLYDKYFYHRPTVSPYLSAVRGGDMSGTAYYTSVKPELERREAAAKSQAAYIQQRKLEGKIGDTRFPGSAYYGATPDPSYLKPIPQQKTTPSAYYNHWYGGWAGK
jgi:hypothetical protein